jgi:hypothetical protein
METVLAAEAKPLSQVERVVDTFIAPSKTFADILRSTSWWLPFILATVVSMASGFAINQKIGFDAVAEQSIQQNAKQEEQMSQMEPAARAKQIHIIGASMKYAIYGSAVIILIFTVIIALLNWASFNFGFGATTTFGQQLAVAMYAGLPRIFIALLNIILIYAGVNTESFDLNNPVGTNIGYYLTDSPQWLKTAGSFFDIFGLWTLALMVIGTSIIAKKSKTQAAIVVVGWWVIGLLISTGMAALRS